jgi:hypothetical protein
MSIYHSTHEEFTADEAFARRASDDEFKLHLDYWKYQHKLIESGKNHEVKLNYNEYSKRLESKLMERYTIQYMNYELSKGIHKNPILQDIYDKVQATKTKKGNKWFLTVSFDPAKFDHHQLDRLSKDMIKFQNKVWLGKDAHFKWQIEQRNNEDEEGYSGYHIHCTYHSNECFSNMMKCIQTGIMKNYIAEKKKKIIIENGKEVEVEPKYNNFITLVKDDGRVDENYMECHKKDVRKLRKQVKDRELQLLCPGSLVVPELTPEDWQLIEDYKESLITK